VADKLALGMIGGHASIEVGSIVGGKYRVEQVLGTGGMGVVVAALHLQLDERVAIKLLRADRLKQPEAVERALREARAAVKIQSDHVARVFDVGTLDDGTPFIVMEYLAGCDLAQLLCAEGKLPVADAASYVVQACDALAKAHAIGIVHRDLKPANLFLAVRDDAATIKVLDFGISKFVAGESGRIDPSLTGTAALLGSPAYMSPEQLESTRDVDARTDVWSLGVILFELLTGAHPFVAESLPKLYSRITEQPAPALRSLRPDAPEALERIVARCLAKKREDRFQDIPSLAEALAPFAGHAMTTNPKRLPAFAATSIADSGRLRSGERARTDAVTPVAITKPTPRGKRMAGLAAVAAVLVLGAAGFAGSRAANRDGASTPAASAAAAAAPLAAPSTVLACPQLRATGVEEPGGWLGAAAATIACTRAGIRMGGHSARTLFPAELLGLPRAPVDGFPADPFAAAGARDGEIAAARTRASAYFDGDVSFHERTFHVTLVLHASSGDREIARGEADGDDLLRAVRSAMEPVERAGVIPKAPDGDPFLAEWYRAKTAEGAVAAIDRSMVFALGRVRMGEEDKALLARSDLSRDLHLYIEAEASDGPSTPAPASPPQRDTSSPGALRMSIENDPHVALASEADDVALLEAAIAKTTEPEGRALLLNTEAAVFENHHHYDRASEAALRSVQEDPKAIDGTSYGWGMLSWLHSNHAAAPASIGWAPWSVEAYCFAMTQSDDIAGRVRNARRDHVLSADRLWTESLVEYLIQDGRRDEARAIAAQAGSDGLRVLVEESDARFGKASAIAHDAIAENVSMPGMGAPFSAFYVAQNESYAALLTGRPLQDADRLVARYLDDGASHVGFLTQTLVLIACAVAAPPTAKHCFARLREIAGGPVGMIEGWLEGAERFSQGDYASAARYWRPMLANPGWQLDYTRDLLAIAFEKLGQDDLVAKVDAPTLARTGRFNGVELAWVRAARRAERQGDKDTAKKLAHQVIDAWSIADVEVPAVAEMRKLVARLD